MDIQVIGVCRFSMLVTGGFVKGPADLDERAAFLFNDRRLAVRFSWFEHVLVPSIRAQTDPDFRLVIVTSDRLPATWRGLLEDIVANVPTMEIEYTAPGPHYRVNNEAIWSRSESSSPVVASFRLDDDDGLARDYIARVRSDFDTVLRPLFEVYGHVACDYARGLILEADGKNARLRQSYVHAWTCGQTIYQKPGAQPGLFTMAHNRMYRHMPTVALQDSNMFVRGRHTANDGGMALHEPDTKDWTLDALPRRFDVSLDALQAALREAADMEG